MLGTVCRITITTSPETKTRGGNTPRLDGAALLDQAFSAISDIERRISRLLPDSELSQINSQAGIEPVVVSEATYDIIRTAFDYAALTDGAFNPAIGPLVSLWGINTEDAHVPSEQELAQVLPLLDWCLVQLDDETYTVFLPIKGMSLDLGGIGKGYAADAVDAILRSGGVTSALVNLGGNILVIGPKDDGKPWRIGLQDPSADRGRYFLSLDLVDGTIVTSGPYERFFEEDGVVYHHILDSRTGYPADTHIVSMTLVGTDSTGMDALSTASFVMGPEKSLAFLETLPGVQAVCLLDDGTIHMTTGLATDTTSWKLNGDQYQVR